MTDLTLRSSFVDGSVESDVRLKPITNSDIALLMAEEKKDLAGVMDEVMGSKSHSKSLDL